MLASDSLSGQGLLEFMILLTPPVECRDFRSASPELLLALLGMGTKALCMLGKHFAN